MWLKITIILLFIALLASLITGFFALMKDKGTSRRTLHSLGLRLILAAAMMSLITYGLYTGQLGSKAPWDKYHAEKIETAPIPASTSP